jgi:chemotaxis signal transduction protein
MDVGAGWRVAAGASHVVEYLLAPETIDVPRTPAHCAGLLIWRDHMIPVIDFAPLPAEQRGPALETRRAIILAYQEAPAQPLRFGALLVTAAPTEAWVSDDMAGQAAQVPVAFRQVARACFVQQDRVIPILDPRRLFSRPLPRWRAPRDDVNARVIQLAQCAPTQPLVPAADAIPPSLPVAQDVPVLGTSPSEAPPPVLSPVPGVCAPPAAGYAGMDAFPSADCTTTVFAPARPDDGVATAPESVQPAETGDLPGCAAPAAGAPMEAETAASFTVEPAADAAATLHGRDDAASAGVASTSAVVQPAPSSTLQSFQRLHAIVQDIESRDHRRRSRRGQRRWWLLAAGVALTMAAGALLMSMDFSVPAPVPAEVSVGRDVAPDGIHPVSVPSTPAQPPQ